MIYSDFHVGSDLLSRNALGDSCSRSGLMPKKLVNKASFQTTSSLSAACRRLLTAEKLARDGGSRYDVTWQSVS